MTDKRKNIRELTVVMRRDANEARRLILRKLSEHGGSFKGAAAALGVSFPYLHWVARKLGISRAGFEIRALRRSLL